MSAPPNPSSLSADDVLRTAGYVVGSSLQLPREQCVRISPLKALDPPEPIPDAKGSLSNEQLKELAKKHRPPAGWFEGDEEQIF